jgi:hypothetical protein
MRGEHNKKLIIQHMLTNKKYQSDNGGRLGAVYMEASQPGYTRAGSQPPRWISPRVYMKLTWRAGSSCSKFFLPKQLHIWKLVPYMWVVCAFWIILIICACLFAKYPALLGGLALPVAFIWKTTQPVYPRSRVTRSGTLVTRASSVLILKFSRKY